jgi:hypothetical protein
MILYATPCTARGRDPSSSALSEMIVNTGLVGRKRRIIVTKIVTRKKMSLIQSVSQGLLKATPSGPVTHAQSEKK